LVLRSMFVGFLAERSEGNKQQSRDYGSASSSSFQLIFLV
jgi:hypothetical protein